MKKNSWSRPTVGLLEKHWQFWCWFHPGRSHSFFSPRPMSWPWLRLWALYIRGRMPRLHASIIAVTAYWRTRRHCLGEKWFSTQHRDRNAIPEKKQNTRTPTQKLWSANIYNKIKMFIEFYRDLYSSILFTKWSSEGLNFFVASNLPAFHDFHGTGHYVLSVVVVTVVVTTSKPCKTVDLCGPDEG